MDAKIKDYKIYIIKDDKDEKLPYLAKAIHEDYPDDIREIRAATWERAFDLIEIIVNQIYSL